MARTLKKPEFCPDKGIETMWKILLKCVKPNVRISCLYADILDCWVFILTRKDYTEQCVRYAHPLNYATIEAAAAALLETIPEDWREE